MGPYLRILVTAGLCFGLLVLWQETSSVATTGPGMIKLVSRQVAHTRVDVGGPGLHPGDTEISNNLLYNPGLTPKPIAHAEFVCTYTFPPARSCRVTVFMPKGKIVLGGSLRYKQLYDLAVLGGTGLYDNARGSLTVTRLNQHPPRDLLVIRLVG